MNVEIVAFTDPVCIWCWGSEPVLRALETWYGDGVQIRYVMGGLVKDITAFYDAAIRRQVSVRTSDGPTAAARLGPTEIRADDQR